MSYRDLYERVQSQDTLRISSRWLTEQVCEISEIKRVIEQHSGEIDPEYLRGFYVQGPLGPPIVLKDNESLIVLSRKMCEGSIGKHWRRMIYTKELMHTFDTDDEKTDNGEKFDLQIRRFRDRKTEMSPQFGAEINAVYRALGVLCTAKRREELKGKLDSGELSIEVVAASLHLPVRYASELMEADFPKRLESSW
jgi:hypothetical protein